LPLRSVGALGRSNTRNGPMQNQEAPLVISALDKRRGGADENEASGGQLVVSNTLKGQRGRGGGGIGPEETLLAVHITQTPVSGDQSPTLGSNSRIGVSDAGSVRRLTPTECERLMGWSDGWTLTHGPSSFAAGAAERDACVVDPQPDGYRYAACGDGVATPVAEWIGRRILSVTP
jgi:site-specific DNA-cytosine methylase